MKRSRLTGNFEFVEVDEVLVVMTEVGVVVEFLSLECRSQEDLHEGFRVLVAVDSEFVGEWFVVQTVLVGLDVERISVLEAVDGDGVVDHVLLGVEEGIELVNLDGFESHSGVVQFGLGVTLKMGLVPVTENVYF